MSEPYTPNRKHQTFGLIICPFFCNTPAQPDPG